MEREKGCLMVLIYGIKKPPLLEKAVCFEKYRVLF